MYRLRNIIAGRPAGIVVAICSVLATAGVCLSDKAPTTAPASGATSKAAKMQQYIKTINESKEPAVILRAYTKATSLDRMDPHLNSAYMRRMMLLGMPRAAFTPARILTAKGQDSGLAWAIIGYIRGQANSYTDALKATARSLEHNISDPSVLNNVGQLVAWYDNAKIPPRIGDRERRVISKLRPKLEKSKAYSEAYSRINELYSVRKKERAQVEGELAGDEAAYAKVRTEELSKRQQLGQVNSQIIKQNKRIKELEKDIRKYRRRLYAVDENGHLLYSRLTTLEVLRQLERSLVHAEDRLKEVRKEGPPLVRDIRVAAAKGTSLRKQIAVHRTKLAGMTTGITRFLRWDPPSVDGKFTPEITRIRRPVAPTTRPSTGEKPKDASEDEEAAVKKLKLARLYANNKRYDRARQILQEILDKHPKTKASIKATALLTKIRFQ